MDYIRLTEIPRRLNFKKGDIVMISSDITELMSLSIKNEGAFNVSSFIDAIFDVIGENGTILIPVFNWDFCHNVAFNYRRTKGETGMLGNLALRMRGFKRTRHPLYSFAVKGKDADSLAQIDPADSFGPDSIFAYLDNQKAKNLIINISICECYTHVHYIEQKVGVDYRYIKQFTGHYIDENGVDSIKTYSMNVRDLDKDVEYDIRPIEKEFIDKGVLDDYYINNLRFSVVSISGTTPILIDDIKNNHSKKLCKFIGQ